MTEPVPDCVSVIVWPEIVVAPAFFATTASVVVVAPTVRAVACVVTVSVEPEILIGICDVTPLAVATMVAVRVVGLLPEENVAVALPVASLTALDELRKPLSTANEMGTPVTAAFEELTTVAVTVTVVLLSDRTVDPDVLRLIAAATGVATTATGVVVVVVVLLDPEPPPPQAARAAVTSATRDKRDKRTSARDRSVFNMGSCR